jgi:hypothetical protein
LLRLTPNDARFNHSIYRETPNTRNESLRCGALPMVPHSTIFASDGRTPSIGRGAVDAGMEKFPDHIDAAPRGARSAGPREGPNFFNLDSSSQRWQPRMDHGHANGSMVRGHGRQKSLSDAIRTIRNRSGSVRDNVHEITDALKAPVSPRLIVSCSNSSRPVSSGYANASRSSASCGT